MNIWKHFSDILLKFQEKLQLSWPKTNWLRNSIYHSSPLSSSLLRQGNEKLATPATLTASNRTLPSGLVKGGKQSFLPFIIPQELLSHPLSQHQRLFRTMHCSGKCSMSSAAWLQLEGENSNFVVVVENGFLQRELWWRLKELLSSAK